MAENPSRRDLFGGLFATGLAWLGMRVAATAVAPAAAVPPPPATQPPVQESYNYVSSHRVTTFVYDASGRCLTDMGSYHPIYPGSVPPTGPATSDPGNALGTPPSQTPPEKA